VAENRVFYYTPGRISLFLEPDKDFEPERDTFMTPEALADFQDVLLHLGLSGLHTDAFHGLTQIPMVRGDDRRVLQTLTLASFKDDIEHDDPNEVAFAVRDVVDHVTQINKLIANQGPITLDKYKLLAESPDWVTNTLCWGCGGPDTLPQPVSIAMRKQFMNASVEAEATNLLAAIGGTLNATKHPVRVVLFDAWPVDGAGDPLNNLVTASGQAPLNDRLAAFAGGTKIPRANFFISNSYLDPAWQQIKIAKRNCYGPPAFQPEYRHDDHGLFVADIVNQIAPDAELMVYRVLNDYGTGRLDGIARAVEDAIHQPGAAGIAVFNFSLGIGCPLAVLDYILAHPTEPLVASTWGPKVTDLIKDASPALLQANLDDPTLAAIRHMMALKAQLLPGNVPILPVGAAGNDSCRSSAPPVVASPRLPAVLEDVVGVSSKEAIPGGNWLFANYTNNDDFLTPPDDGISAFGGPIGLFTRNDLDLVNPDRLVSWTGTSFATAVTSGIAARLISQGRVPGGLDLKLDDVKQAILGNGGLRPVINLVQY